MASDIVGYPRLGSKRERKLAQESFWDGKSSAGDLQKVAADLSVEFFNVKFSYASYKALTKLAFAVQKVVEATALLRALAGQKDEEIFSANAAAQASRKSSPRGQRCGGPKLFVIEETKGDRDSINNTEEEIGISPPANNRSPRPMMVKISGSPIPKTMRVKITVNSCEYIALIDTGSTYNVLHPRVAEEMGLKIIHDHPIGVRTADGSIMRSRGSCPEFMFEIQGGQFATLAYILQLGGFDVI